MSKQAIIALLIITTLLTGCMPSIGNQKTIKIGVLLALTGEGSQYGIPIERTIRLAIEEVNAKGGINGKSIELITEDGKCSEEGGAFAARNLIHNGVKFIIGGACSTETLGAAPITEAASTILFSPSAASPIITGAGSFVFRTMPSDAFIGKIAAREVRKNGRTRVTIISESEEAAHATTLEFINTFQSLGGKITANLNYDQATDTQLAAAITEPTRDAIYISAQSLKTTLAVVTQIKDLTKGATPQTYIREIPPDRDLTRQNRDTLDGVIGFKIAFDENTPQAKLALTPYRNKYGKPPFPNYQAGAHNIVQLLTEGITLFGETPEKVRDWLLMTNERDSAIGPLTIDKNGDAVVAYETMRITQEKHI